MKTEKYYFRNSGSHEDEYCYPESYLLEEMKENGIDQIEVYEAIPDYDSGMAWCTTNGFVIEDSEDTCGKSNCDIYRPRNGKSGCCRSYTKKLYTHGDEITLKRN